MTADDVVDTLIAALNVPGGEAALLETLRAAAAVVILDNCEHVVEAAAALAARLLDAAPQLRILCTSQVPLDIEGEAVFDLAPLPLSDSVELFTRRAAAGRLKGGSDADDAVQDLCRSLDGLPLAIELAAARTRTLSIEEITRRLDDRFSVLSDPTSRRPERRRALKATIGWSYELLFPDDQRGLWALATFAGGAPLPAVESVLEALDVPAAAAIDVIGRLASRSLVLVDDDESRVGAVPAPRQHSGLRTRVHGRRRAVRSRHWGAHAAWLGEAARVVHRRCPQRRPGAAPRLCTTRTRQHRRGPGVGYRARPDARPRDRQRVRVGVDRARRQPGRAADPERTRGGRRLTHRHASCASALLLAAWIEASTGDLERARDHVADAEALAIEIGDVELQARSSYYLAYVVSHDGEFRRAIELTDRSRTLYDGLDRPWDQLANALFAARAAVSAGDAERAVAAVESVQYWRQKVDDPWMHVRSEAVLGELARLAAPVRRRGRSPRPSGRDVAAPRLPADRGVSALQPGSRPVPGRRL